MTHSYLNDLLDQPEALQAALNSLGRTAPLSKIHAKLKDGKFTHLILTGMGSSFHGLYPLLLRLFKANIQVNRLETAELIHYAPNLLDTSNLVVAVSQSGESAEIVQLLELTRGRSTVIGVTNTPTSVLAHNADIVLLTEAGMEASVSCKTYISALAALVWLGDELTGDRTQFASLAELPHKIAEYWSSWQQSVTLLSQMVQGMQHLFLLGRGNSLAAACTGALIIKEAARVAAEGMNCAAFRHGPLELISPTTFALVFSGADQTSELNAKMTQDIRSAGGKAELVSIGAGLPPFRLPDCSPAALPILEIQAAQLLSLALAELQGIEAGQFIHASKVTTVE
jgi:glucosamine--fructose-6-phosphate aminotransferase (isomerizing)